MRDKGGIAARNCMKFQDCAGRGVTKCPCKREGVKRVSGIVKGDHELKLSQKGTKCHHHIGN